MGEETPKQCEARKTKFSCSQCGKLSRAKIGLRSHTRTHKWQSMERTFLLWGVAHEWPGLCWMME